MVKVILKNTFISFAQDEDSDGPEDSPISNHHKACSPRSRSADGRCSSPVHAPQEVVEAREKNDQIEKLNKLLSPALSPPNSPQPGQSGRCSPTGAMVAGDPDPSVLELLHRLFSPLPSGACSPKCMPSSSSNPNLAELEQPRGASASDVAAARAAPGSGAGAGGGDPRSQQPQQSQQRALGSNSGPSEQELKQLQRRLEEVCQLNRRPSSDRGLSLIGGYAAGDPEHAMRSVLSNASISSMGAAEEDHEEAAMLRGMSIEFDLTIEEDPEPPSRTGPWASALYPGPVMGSPASQRKMDEDNGQYAGMFRQSRRPGQAQQVQRHQRQSDFRQPQQHHRELSGRSASPPVSTATGSGGHSGGSGGCSPGRASPGGRGGGLSGTGTWPKQQMMAQHQQPQQHFPRRLDSPSGGGNSRPGSPGAQSPDRQSSPRGEYKPPQRRPKEYRHAHVPKNVNLQEEYRQQAAARDPTTIMIRNIPNHFTQRQMISELDNLGFAGTFDFLYIPLDKGTMSNVGYAFVNFVEPTWATKCMAAFQNHRFKPHRKIAAVSVAHIQGLEANLAHYENAAVNTAKLKQRRPVVMANISQSLNSLVFGDA